MNGIIVLTCSEFGVYLDELNDCSVTSSHRIGQVYHHMFLDFKEFTQMAVGVSKQKTLCMGTSLT